MEGACCQRVTNRCMVSEAAGLREARGVENCGKGRTAQQLCHPNSGSRYPARRPSVGCRVTGYSNGGGNAESVNVLLYIKGN